MASPKFSEDVRPLTDLKTRAGAVVDRLRRSRRPVLLTRRGRGVAVLMDLEEYERRPGRRPPPEGTCTSTPKRRPSWTASARPMARKRKLLWSGLALDDLKEMREYVSRDKPAAARKLAQSIKKSVLRLRDHPLSGRVVPELSHLGYREVIVAPYRIIYEVQPTRVVILRVWHGRRAFD